MKDKITQMVDSYWKFDNQQQPISSWHDKQDLLKSLEELLQSVVIKPLPCHHIWEYNHAADKHYCRTCGEPEQAMFYNGGYICDVRLTTKFQIKYDTHLAYNIYIL